MIYRKKAAIVVSENAASFTFHVRVHYRIFQHKERRTSCFEPVLFRFVLLRIRYFPISRSLTDAPFLFPPQKRVKA